MATSTVQPSGPVPEVQLSAGRTLALSLLWGAFMLFILGHWLGTKHDDLPRLWIYVVWLLALVSCGCGIWQLVTVGRAASSAEQKQAALRKQQHTLGMLLAAGGFVLVALAAYLGVSFKLAAFGEVIGMCFLGLIAVVSGRNLIRGERPVTAAHPFFEVLRRKHGAFGLGLLGLGIALAVTALGLVLFAKLGQDWLPEMAGLLFLGFLAIGSGIWLTLSQTSDLSTAKMRVFVLVVGGVAGLILSLGALGRAIVWREEIFGGMRAWQGDRGWHLWLCAYVELIGLALMFASLLLARTDIRSSAVLRRVLYGYNAVLTGLLLLATLVVLNIVFFAMFPFSFEWSKSRGAHTLSTSTKNLLNNLREPTTIYVFMPRNTLSSELRNFMDNCQNQSTKLQVEYVNPDKDFDKYDDLAKRFPDSLSNRQKNFGAVDRGILIVYGALPSDPTKKAPHAYLPITRLVDEQVSRSKDDGTKVVATYKGESEIMKEVSFLAQDRKKRKLYFLQGNGELDINVKDDLGRRDPRVDIEKLGCNQLVERLKKEQYEVQGLSFAEQLPKDKTENMVHAKEIPKDADAVLIGGPSLPLGSVILDALERYMDTGGRLLVYLDVVLDAKGTRLKTSGLEEFLRKYGVQVGNDFALRAVRQANDDPRVVVATVPPDTTNELAKAFRDEPFPLRTARIVRPETSSMKYKVDVLLQLDPRNSLRQVYWEETAVRALVNPVPYFKELIDQGVLQAKLSSEPLPVAVAVSEKLVEPGSGKESYKPRLTVFGDAEMLSNLDMVRGQAEGSDLSYLWTASALEWMSEKKGLVGPRTKETSTYTINPQKVNVERLVYLPGWLMIMGIMGLGGGIWLVRRR